MQAFFYINAKNISKRKLNRKLDNYTEYLGLIPCADFKQSIEAKNAQNQPILRLKILIQRIVLVPSYDPLQLNNNVENYLADTLSHC